ncbi:FAD-dependent thymidylate synthase [Candidatus Bathyarchaeota archaeon]|nr:FAD-dependent thymidylate synthase [Candidatus Bathyarchaeota archaeon]
MKVTLLNYTKNGIKLIADSVRVSGPFFDSKSDRDLTKYMIKHDFTSTIEHVSFTFLLKDISIAISRELLEHRLASHTARSTRYSDEGETDFYYPKFSCEKDKKTYEKTLQYIQEQYVKLKESCGYEVARYVLPLATNCIYVWTINARSLINFLRLRLCKNAAPEMQELAKKVKRIVEKIYPEIFDSIDCRGSQYKICPEPDKRNCGKYPHK